jgi:hypothetical protein
VAVAEAERALPPRLLLREFEDADSSLWCVELVVDGNKRLDAR